MIGPRRKLCYLAVGFLSFSVISVAQSLPAQTHHVRDAVRTGAAQFLGNLPANTTMQLDIVLPLKDPAGLDAFLAGVYNPASRLYRHFLTPADFSALFGPTQAQYNAVLRFASANGFQVVGGTQQSMDVQVTASASAVEQAFHIRMGSYRHPIENRTFYSPDSEPRADLPFALWHISGLDNYSIPRPLFLSRTEVAKSLGVDPASLVSHATTGSGPSKSFLGSDMRAAYYGGTLDGAGQNLGLFEFQGTDLADVKTYFQNAGQTNTVPITLLSVDGTSTSCLHSVRRCDDTEPTLDITQAIGMAPGLSSLVVYIGSSDVAILGAMTTHSPLPLTIGCSWGWLPADPGALDPYFKRMASQGQTFFAASGDNSTWTRRNFEWPADDQNVVTVGGTDLITSGAAGPWASETAWSDSGGGVSTDFIRIPSYQKIPGVINASNQGSTTLRNGPDVAANANFTFYVCANQTACTANVYGGTSFAAPMWAGYIALANQQAATSGKGPIGFLNPAIYAQNVTPTNYQADFHDITTGTSGKYAAVPGYDLVTGWGSPTAALIDALQPQ